MTAIDRLGEVPDEIEQRFVREFVMPSVQERISHELSSKSKRRKFFTRLSHRHDEVLDSSLMIPIKSGAADGEVNRIATLLQPKGIGKRCYFMADDPALDRTFMDVEAGLGVWTQRSMATILVLRERLALFRGELDRGPPPMFLLERKK